MARPRTGLVQATTKIQLVAERLRRRVAALPVDTRLPSEPELASEYHVSRGTISRAIADLAAEGHLARRRGSGTYVRRPRERSRAAARTPRLRATIGFLSAQNVHIEGTAFYHAILEAVESETTSSRNSLMYARVLETDADEVLAAIEGPRLDGALLVGNFPAETLSVVAEAGHLVVAVDNNVAIESVDFVGTDNVLGARAMMQHLIDLGHRRIGFAYSRESVSFNERYQGYRLALAEADFTCDERLVCGELVPDGSVDQIDAVLPRSPLPTAIFAGNDSYAWSIVQVLQRRGLRVPEDVSVVGFDGEEFAARATPAITTMRVARDRMGRLAAKKLMARIHGEDVLPRKIFLPPDLVVRASSTTHE